MRPSAACLAALSFCFTLALTACGTVSPPHLPTLTPTLTPPPTATPLPASQITFIVHLPANTPANTAPAVKLMDQIGGTSQVLPLARLDKDAWTATLPAIDGDILRYKYMRTLPVAMEEAAPDRQPVAYRLLAAAGARLAVEDTVAAWSDTLFAGELGQVSGSLVSGPAGQPAAGMLVSAGGKLVLTAQDGSFDFSDLPVGLQRVTAIAPDGSLRPVQSTLTVAAGQVTRLRLTGETPSAVRVTFIVRPPVANTDMAAKVRLMGSLWQLGDTFVPEASGSTIAAAREMTLQPLGDGRWVGTARAYAGTVLHYRYTLGDGVWNSELNFAGGPRLRRLIIPAQDISLEDTIDTWHTGASASVTFELTVPPNTPSNDLPVIQFRKNTWQSPLPMWRIGANVWRFVLYNPENASERLFYRYCRNYACNTADDTFTVGPNAEGRFFSLTLLPQEFIDSVSAWQWLPATSPTPAPILITPFTPTTSFAAGIDLSDDWPPHNTAQAFYTETLRTIQSLGANWLTFTRRSAARQIQPNPAYADDLALSPWPSDWTAQVALAHAANLRVALHPVTCRYTPYGACDYWQGVAFTADFWNRWFAAYEKYLLNEADLAAGAGVDLFVVGDFKLRPALPGEPEAPADAEARWRALLAHVRQHYGGRLGFELLMGQTVWPSPPAFLDAVDIIRIFWWSTLSGTAHPPLQDVTAAAEALMDQQLWPVQQKFKKPLYLSAAYYSAQGTATQCLKRADGQCYSFESFAPDSADLPPYGLALQEQADVYQALLTAVSRRPWIAGFSSYGYHPVVTLLDKSISVRGKPASFVLGTWYPLLTGR
jgi:hypothetical protein